MLLNWKWKIDMKNFGLIPLWELQKEISKLWHNNEFETMQIACHAWWTRTGRLFTVGDLIDK